MTTKKPERHLDLSKIDPDVILQGPQSQRDTPFKKDPVRPNKHITLERAESWWITKSRENPIYFMWYMYGLKPALHHYIWAANLFSPTVPRLNLIAPRESAKTNWMLAMLGWFIGKSPLSTNLVLSVSSKQSKDRLRVIRDWIQHDSRYNNVFPDINIDPYRPNTQTEFSIWSSRGGISYNAWASLRQKHNPKDPTLYVAGIGGKGVIGRRISGLYVGDDLIDETYLNPELQEQAEQYIYQTVVPCIQETGKALHIGTRWMMDDLPERLEKNESWKTITISAIHSDPDTGEEKSYWPEWWPLTKLKARKDELKNDVIWRLMYLSDPRGATANMFTIESLSQGIPHPLPAFTAIYIGVDLAVSLKQQADYTVYTAVGLDRSQNIYVLDMVRIKATGNVMVDELAKFADRIANQYGMLTRIVIEKIAFQALFLQNVLEKRPDLPLDGYVPKGDKAHRAGIVSAKALRGELFINKHIKDYSVLVSECMNFPLAKHDDTLDSISLLLQYLGLSIVPSTVKRVKSSYLL